MISLPQPILPVLAFETGEAESSIGALHECESTENTLRGATVSTPIQDNNRLI
jgi:hypothetical protein